MERRQIRWTVITVLTGVALLVAILVTLNLGKATGQGSARPPVQQPTYTLLSPTRLVSGTLYTSSPRRDGSGLDMTDTRLFAGADVFVAADMEPGAELVAQVELSPDRVHWAPVRYETVGFNGDGVEVIETMPPLERRLDADGQDTEYFLIVLAGQYLRVKLEATGVTTPSVWVTYRDYPQWP